MKPVSEMSIQLIYSSDDGEDAVYLFDNNFVLTVSIAKKSPECSAFDDSYISQQMIEQMYDRLVHEDINFNSK
jgi:hypothetical protein